MKRILERAKPWEIVLWWVGRAIMIATLIWKISVKDSQAISAISLNLAGTFMWELFQFLPKKSLLRYLPSYSQDISVIFLVLCCICGMALNLYYSAWWWDTVLHLFGGALGAICGYEYIVAVQTRDRIVVPVVLIPVFAFAFSFVIGNFWELFEFTADQVIGADSQHWNYELYLQNKMRLLFDMKYECRYALMDTMEDMICNTVGSVVAAIGLKFFPYRHRGRNDLNKIIANEKKTVEKELVIK